jgi:N-acetylmuramoyl-L-alanine amidase
MLKLISVVVAVLVALVVLAPTADGQGGPDLALEVQGSPLVPGSGDRIEARVTLASPARLRLEVVDFDGRVVRELFKGTRKAGTLTRVWHGRDADRERVPDGPYRVVATATAAPEGTSDEAEAWVTVADWVPYPQRPGSITVAVDPGHGGEFSGARGADGTREADLNLDIGLRLARMLEGAGINVVLTRTSVALANEPAEDRNGNGVVDVTDDLAARPDVANTARADLFLAIHNNVAVSKGVGGPSTLYFDERSFASRSARLARVIQAEMMAALSEFASGGWEPYDHGVLIYPYYVLRDYDPPRLLRPTQMPGVLSEGLFLSNERELRLLQRPAVRGAMAAAYYDAIAQYLARRGEHIGYEAAGAPGGPVPIGEVVTYAIEVRNQGTEQLRGWLLQAEARPAPARYVGRIRSGTPAGAAPIPRLAPGEGAVVEVAVTAPDTGGDWVLLFDARDDDGRRASLEGSAMLQWPLTTFDPAPASGEPSSIPESSATLESPVP